MSKSFGIIYKVTNLINSKCYIGQTTKSLDDRRFIHIKDAKRQKYNSLFHKAIIKYGIDNFKWEVLCVCEDKM